MSPFPGIDPYIEAQDLWPDFHHCFLTYSCDQISLGLPDLYVARMEEYVHLVRTPREPSAPIRPDILVARKPGRSKRARRPDSGVATLEPVTVPLETEFLEEVR